MLKSDWSAQLDRLGGEGLLRQPRVIDSRSGVRVEIEGRTLLNFSSNDYLNLSQSPQVRQAACDAVARWGAGTGGSRLVTGNLALHRELEANLAAFKGAEAALAFSSGYLAALGLVQVLTRRSDDSVRPVFFDRLAHASLVDAARTSGAPWRSFRHNDPESLEDLLRKAARRLPADAAGDGSDARFPRAVAVTEGVFSMDGDLAPLPDLLAVCERWGAALVVDDAHGTGVTGPGGRGTAAHFALPSDSPHLVQLGTLSKALGSQGGFAAGTEALVRLLESRARTFIYDTALAPPCAAAAAEALRVMSRSPDLSETLAANARLLRAELAGRQLNVLGSGKPPAPIIPWVAGDAGRAVAAAEQLRNVGFLAVAIRPPTVAPGTSRLRLTVTAAHTPEQIRELAAAIVAVSKM